MSLIISIFEFLPLWTLGKKEVRDAETGIVKGDTGFDAYPINRVAVLACSSLDSDTLARPANDPLPATCLSLSSLPPPSRPPSLATSSSNHRLPLSLASLATPTAVPSLPSQGAFIFETRPSFATKTATATFESSDSGQRWKTMQKSRRSAKVCLRRFLATTIPC